MKELLIARLIQLSLQNKQPGFEDSPEVMQQKFSQMPEKELLTCFELTVLTCHANGIQ